MANPTYSADELAARVRAARAYAGLEREDVARALNLSVRTYSRIESAARPPTPEERMAIAEACSVPPLFMEIGWALAAPNDDSEGSLSSEEITRAAALLAPQLLAAARALRQASEPAPPGTAAPGHRRRAAGGGAA